VWKVDFWTTGTGKGPVEKWLDKLTRDQFKSVAKQIEILAELGNELRFPRSRPLGDGLFELRERQFEFRIYYCFQGSKMIILLAAGDKSSQERDIATARKRLGSK
jgi:putative addiction module killer protein